MLTSTIALFRSWMAMDIDEVLMLGSVFSAHDWQGRRYLVARTGDNTWLCAPITERALECVASGRAELRSVFAHSATGMVEQLTVKGARVCHDELLACSELSDDDLPVAGLRIQEPACCA